MEQLNDTETYYGLHQVDENPFRVPTQKNEENILRRRSFINRKLNKFTYSTRYLVSGKTKNDKIWSKWQTLLSVSVTVKNGKVNVFLTGSVGKRTRYSSVVNISRQGYLVDSIIGYGEESKTFPLFMKELQNLLERTEHPGIETFNPTSPASVELLNLVYPAWFTIVGSLLSPHQKLPYPPLFAAQIMREPTLNRALEKLTSLSEVELREHLAGDPNPLSNPQFLLYLMLTRKILTTENRLKELTGYRRNSVYSTAPTYGNIFSSGVNRTRSRSEDFSAEHFAAGREFFKKLSSEQQLVLSKRILENVEISTFNQVASEWSLNKYTVKDKEPSLSFVRYDISNWQQARNALTGVVKEIVEADSTNKIQDELSELLKKVSSLPHLNVNSHFSKTTVTAKINHPTSLGVFAEYYLPVGFSSRPRTNLGEGKYYIQVPKNRNYTLRKLLDENKINYGKKYTPLENAFHFEEWGLTAKEYLMFLKSLLAQAEKEITQAKIDFTDDSLGKWLAMFLIVNSENKPVFKYSGNVPRKWFTLIRKGASLDVALLMLNKRVPIKTAEGFLNLPESWVFKSLGVDIEEHGRAAFF